MCDHHLHAELVKQAKRHILCYCNRAAILFALIDCVSQLYVYTSPAYTKKYFNITYNYISGINHLLYNKNGTTNGMIIEGLVRKRPQRNSTETLKTKQNKTTDRKLTTHHDR